MLLAEAAGGRRSFSHPFADFGSRGARAPFRVVCLYGRFDADALIAKFKEIGTAKHTIVLLDYALSEDQRRRFARKTKSDIPECAFALVDRVVAAYIAEHYEETKLPQMLFSITMPYTFYQPYIPNAANAMPPEMFIGRKAALEKIIAPLGENIIYGGRQLGKSALLRMAEHSINRLGAGSCALMVDIKSCDVEEAAGPLPVGLGMRGFHISCCSSMRRMPLSRAAKPLPIARSRSSSASRVRGRRGSNSSLRGCGTSSDLTRRHSATTACSRI